MSDIYSREKTDELVSRIKQGDKEAIGIMYDAYAPRIFGVITKIVSDEKQAESLLQTVFLEFISGIKRFESSNVSLLLYLVNLARALSISSVNTVQQNIQNSVDHVYINGNANFAQLSNEETGNLRAFELIYFKGYSIGQAAAEFGITTDELKKKLRKELGALREVKVNG